MNWTKTENKTPEAVNKFGESKYVLGWEYSINMPVVVWYNVHGKTWHVAHNKADSLPINISHWKELPKEPKI